MKFKYARLYGVLLLSTLLNLCVTAQKDSTNDSKIWVGISIQPKLAFRYSEFRLDPNEINYELNQLLFEELDDVESPKMAIDYLLSMEYQWTQRFAILSGIGFLNKGEVQVYKVIENADTTLYDLHNIYNYLSVPVIGKYQVLGDKLTLNLVGGAAVNYFLQKKGRYVPELDDYVNTGFGMVKRIKKIDFASAPLWNFDLVFGIDLTYQLGERYRLSISPRYTQEFLEIAFEENGIYETHYSYGLNVAFLTNL